MPATNQPAGTVVRITTGYYVLQPSADFVETVQECDATKVELREDVWPIKLNKRGL